MSKFLKTLKDVLARRVEEVYLPGMADALYIKVLSVAERNAAHREVLGPKLDKEVSAGVLNAYMLAAMLTDKDGNRLSEEERKDMQEAFLEGSTAVFDHLLEKAAGINALGPTAVADAEKN